MTTEHTATINGEVLRLQREAKGWTLGDLAARACLSIKQVRQLEEGGNSSFYSESVKINTAKKVAGLLDISTSEVFNIPESEIEVVAEAHMPSQLSQGIEIEIATASSPALESSDDEEIKGKTPIWSIAALFLVAVGVAALLRPSADNTTLDSAPIVQAAPDNDVAASASAPASAMESATPAASDASSGVPSQAAPSAPSASKP
jgi:transcriptional regulator with XRE-family HTH domain